MVACSNSINSGSSSFGSECDRILGYCSVCKGEGSNDDESNAKQSCEHIRTDFIVDSFHLSLSDASDSDVISDESINREDDGNWD